MARVYTWRGMTIEELQKLDVAQFSKLLKSRQRRTIKRMGMDYKRLIARVEAARKKGKVVKTHIREAIILPSWVGMNFAIHNGKEFKQTEIRPEMLGHRLGEFAFSTKRVLHSAPGIRATRGSKFLAVK
ncbi:MAG: 30S ribosomal protein S19 [Candidatus Micrarchaeota archaeon]|nr:30S ribosomal protein S19 [Candidatus Micrarchaeota archaeon]